MYSDDVSNCGREFNAHIPTSIPRKPLALIPFYRICISILEKSMTSSIQALLEAADRATPGPWRITPHINIDEKDRTKILETFYSINAGRRDGPFENDGWFHPSMAQYYMDELEIVPCGYNDDYLDYEESVSKEDAAFIVAARNAIPALKELLARLKDAEDVIMAADGANISIAGDYLTKYGGRAT